MGYDLSIIRRSNWDDYQEESNITLEEWLAYGLADPDLRLNETEEKGFFEWVTYPDAEDAGFPWFSYWNGMISTKNPNFFVIQKLSVIAHALNAKVFGEEGEEYDENFLAEIS